MHDAAGEAIRTMYNSIHKTKDTVGCMLPPNKSSSRYIKLSKFGEPVTKTSSTNSWTRDIPLSTTAQALNFKQHYKKSNS
jgi:hypothetical protein